MVSRYLAWVASQFEEFDKYGSGYSMYIHIYIYIHMYFVFIHSFFEMFLLLCPLVHTDCNRRPFILS